MLQGFHHTYWATLLPETWVPPEKDIPLCEFKYNAPNSASAADDMTAFIISVTLCIAPFGGGSCTFSIFKEKEVPACSAACLRLI